MQASSFLPLDNYTNIIEGNALRIDWSDFSENSNSKFVYAEKLNVYKVERDFGGLDISDISSSSLNGQHFKELNVITKDVEEKQLPKISHEKRIYDYIIGNPPFVGYGLQTEIQKNVARV